MAKGRHWTAKEDRYLLETVRDHLGQGEDKSIAFEVVAKHLERTARGCSDHWNMLYRNRKVPLNKLRPLDVMTGETNENHAKVFDQFMQSFVEIKQLVVTLQAQNQQLVEQNRQLLERVEELERESVLNQDIIYLAEAITNSRKQPA